TGRSGAVVNSHEIITGDFTRDTEFRLPSERLKLALEARLKDGLQMFDASALSRNLLGDSIYSNMMVFGAAWQRGLVPVSHGAIAHAITLNGVAPERNQRAFDLGRWAVVNPDAVARVLVPGEVKELKTLEQKINYFADHLVAYQSRRLARRYRKFVARAHDPRLREALARGYHKVLAYKDEYEVARLLVGTRAKAQAEFDGDLKLTYHMAPPLISRKGADGRPVKREFGAMMERFLPILARFKVLRGTPLDPFGYFADRRLERELIRQYQGDMAQVLRDVKDANLDAAVALAELPLQIRGFGPVKEASRLVAMKRRDELFVAFRARDARLGQAAE
ncbi:indolepyruvate ferredoxin oxidoreductase family protein, partial [Rhodobacteraceae bacterium R_SAG10]|nr:indolepyruvate ferredoxin oxidoreductase family protein [Rhodobacteraceae bacterium R_SAG10]